MRDIYAFLEIISKLQFWICFAIWEKSKKSNFCREKMKYCLMDYVWEASCDLNILYEKK